MLFRGRRQASRRVAIVAFSLLTYLSSVAPASATIIYCISDDGHSGFELVASGERGCSSCCHEVPAAAAHEGFAPSPTECTDIALSSDQALRASASFEREAVSFAPAFFVPITARLHSDPPDAESLRAALAPPRSSPAVLVRHTVLLI